MLPVKMLECIALGIPVVAPRLKTITHYFTRGDGVFTSSRTTSIPWREAILQASSSAEGRLSRAREARRFLEKNGWESHKSDFLRMYQ